MGAPVPVEPHICTAPAQPLRKPAGRAGPSPAASGGRLPPLGPRGHGACGCASTTSSSSGRVGRKRPRPGAAGMGGGAEGLASEPAAPASRLLRRPPAPRRASPRLLKLGLRVLPLLLGSSTLLAVGATAAPTGGPTSPQGAKTAGLPPAVGNAKVVVNAAARTLASSGAGGKGAAGGARVPKGLPPRPPPPLSAHHHQQHGQRLLDDHSLVKLLFLIMGLFWILVVVGLLYWAPVVSFLNLVVLSVIVLFIKSEGATVLHHAQEHENRFWTGMAFVGALVLVFSPDSPLAIGRWSWKLGVIIAAAVAFAVHSYDRHLHRVNISRKPQFVRTRRTTAAAPGAAAGAERGGTSLGISTSVGGGSVGGGGSGGGSVHYRGASTNSLPLPSQPLSPPSTPPTSQRGGHGLSTSLPGSSSQQRPRAVSAAAGGPRDGAEGDETTRTQRALSFSGSGGAGADPAAVTSPVHHRSSLGASPLPGSLPISAAVAAEQDASGKGVVAAAAAVAAAGTVTAPATALVASISTSATSSSGSGSGSGSLSGCSTGGSLPVSPTGTAATTTTTTGEAVVAVGVVAPAAPPGVAAAAAVGAETATAVVAAAASALESATAPALAPAPVPPAPSQPQRLLGLLLESSNLDGEKVLDAVARSAAEEKLEVIEHALKEVDQYLIASTITNYFNVQRVLRLERTIINIFNAARTDELNFLVSHVPLGLLFYKVKDHSTLPASGARHQHRTDLIEVLAVTRISELGIPERAMVLDALQQMKLTAHRQAEKWVRNILLSTLGDSLSELKTLMDAKGDFQSLHKLIFDDIRSERVRHEILVHIRKQAQVQAAHMKLGTRLARQRRERQPWRKILSDVDDTLVSSGGRFPAGMDRRLPRHAVYPGVLAFYRELDLGVTDAQGPSADEWGPDRDQGNLVFLSARPHLYKDVSEKHSYAKFRRLQAERGMHTTPTLLAGSLDSGYSYVMERNIEGLAVKKMENFEQFVSLYPEYSFVFIGDNGQGDLRAAELMVQRAREEAPKHPRIDAVYIHRVQPLSRSYGYDEQAFSRWRDMGICFFDNYIEAAMDAAARRDPPLIRLTGLRRVVEAAAHDFGLIEAWPAGERDRELRRMELNRSIRRANDLLAKHGLAPVPCIPASPKARFEPRARVMTLYGAGVVRRYRPDDGVYEVVLDWVAAAAASASAAAGGRLPAKRLSLNGAGASAAATPLAMTPLSISPPRVEHRVRSESLGGPPSPLTLPSPKLVAPPSSYGQPPASAAAASAAALALAEAGMTSPVPRSVSASATCAAPGPTPGTGSTPLPTLPTPSVGSISGGGGGFGVGGPRSSLGGGPYAFPRGPAPSPVVAYLQEAAILQEIVPSSANKAAAPASSAATGLSSYISFFPGASYLSRLRSDRSANRFAPGTAVRTPYGPGVIIQHRPAKPAAAAAAAAAAAGTGAGAGAAATAPSTAAIGEAAAGVGLESVPGTPAVSAAAATPAPGSASASVASATGGGQGPQQLQQQLQQQAQAQETCVVQLKWGAKAFLPVSQLALAGGGAGGGGLTSPRAQRGGVPGTPGGGLEPSAGLLAGMMSSLLSLGSGRGKSGGPAAAGAAAASGRAGKQQAAAQQRGQLLVVPGMNVTTKLGPGVVVERREADGVTVLRLGAGGSSPVATVYVPAAALTDFLTPPGGRNSGSTTPGAGLAAASTAPPRGTPNSKRKSLSPPSAGAAAAAGGGSSLLGFFKATVVPSSAASAASGAADGVPLATVVIKEEPPASPLPPLPPSQQRSRANSVDSEVSIASSISTTSTGLRGWFARATAATSSTSSLGGGRARRLAVGDRVSVKNFGEAVVLRVRPHMIEVAFTKWRGRGFVREDEVQKALLR